MSDLLRTAAESRAAEAENLPAFSGLKLLHIKREVTTILSLIGREGIFDEYTLHDITHVDDMLRILDWLIPEATKKVMSPADWIMIVLAIYFHDLGMLVTKKEYAERNHSAFRRYCEEELFSGTDGQDYKARITKQYPDGPERERFLYQEFVRHNHARRVKAWIAGSASSDFGVSTEIASAVKQLLAPLDEKFLQDLALVCESHHLDDLQDTQKYVTSQPYGNSREETANLQYAAILLRSADLLNITRNRTPSVAFRIITPSDPVSQIEWAKQLAVRSVRPQPVKPTSDESSVSPLQDTIEVHARFTEAAGFFGLTSYLSYASLQIRKSHDWATQSNRLEGTEHRFPWRRIDDTKVEASGFLPTPFAFEIDQARILDLLTGHTLYNDTGVVLRELVQNGMDAVRLQTYVGARRGEPVPTGEVFIHWDSQKRALTVRDNGTGMTQDIVEKHFLRVGSSRYQDPDFRKSFPEFSAISRFGIGVLSCFMVADDVDLVTVHPDDPEARHISLRSIHGKYLIRLLAKSSSEAQRIGFHGTEIRLTLRPSASIGDVVDVARRWIVIPGCSVKVAVDSAKAVEVGFDSPKDALVDVLSRAGYDITHDGDEIKPGSRAVRVRQASLGAATVAYAVTWSNSFKEWSFLDLGARLRAHDTDAAELNTHLGTCIEGIRVELGTPGFTTLGIAAIVNASGPGAPKTNVARSSIEGTPELSRLLTDIYDVYASHIREEIGALHKDRGFSLTWAAQEAYYLLQPLLNSQGGGRPRNIPALMSALRKLPVLVVESEGKRTGISPELLQNETSFWTSDSALFKSAEELIREAPGEPSLSSITTAFGAPEFVLPSGILLCSGEGADEVTSSAFTGREVIKVRVFPSQRRVDLLWGNREKPARWAHIPAEVLRASGRLLGEPFDRYSRTRISSRSVLVGRKAVEVEGLNGKIAVRAQGTTFFLHGTPIASYLVELLDGLTKKSSPEDQAFVVAAFQTVENLLTLSPSEQPDEDDIPEYLTRFHPRLGARPEGKRLAVALRASPWGLFDPAAWKRSSETEAGLF